MAMALAVALVACSAATSVKGEQGPQGAQGQTGPAGPAGESSNESPMLKEGMELPMVYLAMGGTGMMTNNRMDLLDLSKYFEDKESPTLEFKVKSDDEDVVTVSIVKSGDKSGDKIPDPAENAADGDMIDHVFGDADAGKVFVKANKAGNVKIMVEVYDSVNEAVMDDFDVIVVANNIKPIVVGDISVADKKKLLTKLNAKTGASTVTIGLTTHPGAASDGVEDSVKISGKATGDIVKVTVTEGSKPNTWDVTLDPKKSGTEEVKLTAKDMFGVESTTVSFVAHVNTTPSNSKVPMQDATATAGSIATSFDISTHFDVAEKSPALTDTETTREARLTALDGIVDSASGATDVTDAVVGDTSCSWSTSPVLGSGGDTLLPAAVAADGAAVPFPTDATAGQYDLTITCWDGEDTASDTATITVLP